MLTFVIVMIVLTCIGCVVLIARYTYGDPFRSCDRRVYIDAETGI